jgi:outer membrane protein assembly factor BamC
MIFPYMSKAALRRFSVLGLTLCMAAVAACSNTKKEDEPYKDSKALPPLEVPPDLITPPQDANTAIPALPPAAPAAPATTPPAIAAETKSAGEAAPAAGALHVEKQGAQRWLVVPAPADQVWRRVKDFLIEKGFTLAKEDEKAGTLETDWRGGERQAAGQNDLDAALKSGLQDKYKLRIETGRVAGTSEVSVSHLGLQRVVTDGKPEWQPRVSDPMLEADLLDQLRGFFQSEGTAPAPVSDLPAVKAKVSTDTTTSISTLSLNEDFDRAWRRIGLALGRGGFVIEDRNRSEGIYLIRLGTAFKEDAKAGFVARLFGSNAGDANERFRIHVKDEGDQCAVIVEHPGGAPVHTSIGARILNRLKDKME